MAQFKKKKKKVEIPLAPKSKKEIALEFYNLITGSNVNDLPDGAWEFLCRMKKECIINSLFLHHKSRGVSPGKLQIKYGVNLSTIKYHIYTAPKNRSLKDQPGKSE